MPTTTATAASDDPDTASRPGFSEADPRVAAFCSQDLLPELFESVAQATDVWRDDPFDVKSIHQEARARFGRMLDRAANPSPVKGGRMLLLLGDSGSGKTHLMRAFRNAVHAEGRGYFGYLQMTAYQDQYNRYVLHNLVESLDKPYHEPLSPQSGLMRLSDHLAEAACRTAPDRVAELREGGLPQARIDELVNILADEVIRDDRFGSVDVYVVQAFLYLQCGDPAIKARVLRYLRCDDLTSYDRRLLGGIVPRVYPDAPSWMIQRLGELMWAVERAPLVLCVDQIEEMFDLQDAATRFRRALATLCDIVSRLPSALVVISCLEDFYEQLRPYLIRPTLDRVESERGPLGLKAPREADEVVSLIGERLRYLYEKAGVPFDSAHPINPLPEALVAELKGLRTRDVLGRIKLYRERCVEEGKMVAYPFQKGEPVVDPDPRSRPLDTTLLEQRWNDFRATFNAIVPADEDDLASILAAAIPPCSGEVGAGVHFEAEVDGRFVQAERQAADDAVRRTLIGVCNKGSQGGALGRQIEELMKRAGEGEHATVVVRSAQFPEPKPKTALSKIYATLLEGGGRRIVVEDSDWRTMMAFRRFRDQNQAEQAFSAWVRQARPLTGLASLRKILRLDLPEMEFAPDPVGGSLGSGPATTPQSVDAPSAEVPPGLDQAQTSPARPISIVLGRSADRRATEIVVEPSELTRHAAFLGGSGSGKTTLAMNLVERLLLAGIPAILIDRKGDLCSWAKLGLGTDEEIPLNEGAADRLRMIRDRVDVALYTPRRPDGRPLSIRAVPAGLGSLPDVEREQAARFAASALAGMMGYGDGARDRACLAILAKAIDLLGQEAANDRAAVGIVELVDFIAERDPILVDAVGRLDEKNFERLVQGLETLRLNQGDLLNAQGEPLDVEALLGLGSHTRPGKTRLSIISTKFLGHASDIQFWVAQFLMDVGRWIGRSPAPNGTLQAVILFDEADLYLPAVGKPATKEPMENLLRRARSAGLGILLASQSPGDFDYRCRENIRAWFLGRIKEDTAINKLKPMLNECRGDIAARLPSQEPGAFCLIRDGDASPFRADSSALAPRQLAENEILALARCHGSR